MGDRAEKLLELARERFGELTEAEEKFFRAVAEGQKAEFLTGNKEIDDPVNAEKWGKERLLKANRIVWVCTDNKAKKVVTHKGIQVEGAKIEGKLDLSFSDMPFPFAFWYSAFNKEINLQHAYTALLSFGGTLSKSIKADGLKVNGELHLIHGFRAMGEVRLLGVEIGGGFACIGGTFDNPNGIAIFADSLYVKGSVSITGHSEVNGEVRFVNAKVDRDFSCKGSMFNNSKGVSIAADGMKVAGGVFFCDGFQANGEVRLNSVEIGGMLDCSGGLFYNPGARAISADEIKTGGHVYCRNGFQVVGGVVFVAAELKMGFQWHNINTNSIFSLDLRSVKTGSFWIGPESWPAAGQLEINGLEYNEAADPVPQDAQTCIDFLNLQPTDKYRPQPYEQMAKVLKASGHEEEAKKVLIEKNRVRLERGGLKGWERFWLKFLGGVAGYGYQPWKAGIYALLCILLGIAVFWVGNHSGHIVKGDPTNKMSFDPVSYSIDKFVPIIDLDQAKHWRLLAPIPRKVGPDEYCERYLPGSIVYVYHYLHIMAGWVLTTIFIVGLTGAIKQ